MQVKERLKIWNSLHCDRGSTTTFKSVMWAFTECLNLTFFRTFFIVVSIMPQVRQIIVAKFPTNLLRSPFERVFFGRCEFSSCKTVIGFINFRWMLALQIWCWKLMHPHDYFIADWCISFQNRGKVLMQHIFWIFVAMLFTEKIWINSVHCLLVNKYYYWAQKRQWEI